MIFQKQIVVVCQHDHIGWFLIFRVVVIFWILFQDILFELAITGIIVSKFFEAVSKNDISIFYNYKMPDLVLEKKEDLLRRMFIRRMAILLGDILGGRWIMTEGWFQSKRGKKTKTVHAYCTSWRRRRLGYIYIPGFSRGYEFHEYELRSQGSILHPDNPSSDQPIGRSQGAHRRGKRGL